MIVLKSKEHEIVCSPTETQTASLSDSQVEMDVFWTSWKTGLRMRASDFLFSYIKTVVGVIL